MPRVPLFALCALLILTQPSDASPNSFWKDGYKNFFADRPKIGHTRWIALQKQGWQYVQRHAADGNPDAIWTVGRVYFYSSNQFMTGYHDDALVSYPDGRLIRKTDGNTNKAEGCRWFLKGANAGSVESMRFAGVCHENGYGVAKDYDKAVAWYQRSAEKGNYDGSHNLAKLYMNKIGDHAKARQWLRYGIDRGFKYGFYELGRLWEQGKGGPKDIDKARQNYERADYPLAAKYYLGRMYEEGRGVPKNLDKAAGLYKQASDDGEVGRLAKSRYAAIKDETARKETHKRQAALEAERRRKAAEAKAAEARRVAASRAEQARIAKLTAGLSPTNQFREVAAANATIRKLPERKAKSGRKLQLGEQVHVVGLLPSGWAQIAEEGVPAGWVHRSTLKQTVGAVQPLAGSPTPTTLAKPRLLPLDAPYTVVRNANVRARPDIRSERTDKLAAGEKITALAKVDGLDWYLVARGDRRLGYVFGPLMKPAKFIAAKSTPDGITEEIDFGRFHALVIGNNNYKNVSDLETAVSDAQAVAALLRGAYGYDVKLLLNATRAQILRTLTELRRTLTNEDNLLVYYAGHGWLDPDSDRGYWLPVDADRDDPTNWISNASITDAVRAIRAKHVMVVADSCYSGSLTRGVNLSIRTPDHVARLSAKAARTVLTSGGLEPVSDRGGGGHSVFANAFLAALKENDNVLDGHGLFAKIRRPIMVNSDQTPDYGDIRKAGHAGGDFLFVRRN